MSSCQTAAVVACRVLGLYIGIRWLGVVPISAFKALLEAFEGAEFRWLSLAQAITMLVVPAVVAVVLWTLAPWIARHMLGHVENGGEAPSAATMEEAQVVAISVLGIFLAAEAAPGIVKPVLDYFWPWPTDLEARIQFIVGAERLKLTVMSLVQIGLGLWLFLGARGVVRVFQWFNSPKAG